jgi:electron transport complex protein RnfC
MATDSKGRLSFFGGVHPPQNKHLTENSPIQPGPPAKESAIFLSQHIGVPCQPVVKKGDVVQAGQKLGNCEAFISAPVHAPVGGTVKEIALRSHPLLGRTTAVVIEAEGDVAPPQPAFVVPQDFDPQHYTSQQICDAAREAGLVGMGGAGFPTSVKIMPDAKVPKHTLIVNGCECEPYITCDYRLLLEWTDQIIAGARLAQQASGATRILIGIEDNKPQAIELVAAAIDKQGLGQTISVVSLRTKYPQGGERQLINAVLRKTVPTGGIPPMIGVVVINVATSAALAEATIANRPLTHRVVTVTGEAVARPGNYYVAIGTPVQTLIDHCGGIMEQGAMVVMGGPMMGLAIADLSTPITKTSGALTVLTGAQVGAAGFERPQTPCIRCGRCIQACPENLNPTRIAHAVKYGLMDVAESNYITACIECGCCSYTCPAKIDLTGYIKTGKILRARQKKKMPA